MKGENKTARYFRGKEYNLIFYNKELANFLVNFILIINILGFAGHIVSVATFQCYS